MSSAYLIFGLAGLLALVSFMPPLAGRLHIPYSVLLAIVGFLLGLVLHVQGSVPWLVSDFLTSLRNFDISSETFLFVFLPVLLFETSLAMNVRRLLDDIWPILMMAIVAVLVCTVAVGFSLSAFSSYGLVVCLLLGAIVATTDPIAVVGVFREVGAPRRLTNLVEGESLFNDAASIALYSVLLSVLFGQGELLTGTVVTSFLKGFIGGGLAGFLMARLAISVFIWLRGWPTAEITLTVALAYLTFYISDRYLGVSGVVATVIAGLVVGSAGRTRMSPTTFEQLASAWSQFGFWANSLIFVFAAMLIPRMMADITFAQVGLILLLFVVTLLARAVMVFGVLPLLGMTPLATRVSRAYRVVMCWGGLRGAVSLALALAVTEHQNIPYEIRQFIAVATTGFVLMTLFINGVTLRPLIRRLKLNELSPFERTLRNQAVVVVLDDLRHRTDDVARTEHVDGAVLERIRGVFDNAQASIDGSQVAQLTVEQKVSVGLSIVASREEELFFERLKAQILDWRTAETLLARAEQFNEAVRARGMAGFESVVAAEVRYSRRFRLALRMHYLFGMQSWLAAELATRFVNLLSKRTVARQLIPFVRKEIEPLLGPEATQEIVHAHEQRLAMLDKALSALRLQYPVYADWLQEAYLGRVARAMERQRYRDMLQQSLLTSEMYSDMIKQINQRWAYLEQRPQLDIQMATADLVRRVPLFQGLSDEEIRIVSKVLKPRLAVPDQAIQMTVRRNRVMYIVASGAVSLLLPDRTSVELGTGEIFGEMALVTDTEFEAKATSRGYTRLLMLREKDLANVQNKYPALREKIESAVQQRRRALQVWQEFESGQRQYEPYELPDEPDNRLQ
jgi:CPA1 family monovalent cation:H+ antiporter